MVERLLADPLRRPHHALEFESKAFRHRSTLRVLDSSPDLDAVKPRLDASGRHRVGGLRDVSASLVSAAMASTIATADITNGSFSNGSEGWTQFGGSEGPYDVGFFGGNAAVVAYGTFGGTPNYSGYTQDLGVTGDYAAGDIIAFGGEMYIENGKSPYAGNNGNIQLNFWYGAAGTDYGFSVVAGTVNADSLTDTVYLFNLDYVLDEGAASATRISLDFTYVQTDIPAAGVESGAVWGTNFYGSVVPAPGAIALLGVAGLASRRRRG